MRKLCTLLLQAIGQAFTLFSLIVIVLSNADPARATAFSVGIQASARFHGDDEL